MSEQDKKELHLMMVTAGENMVRKIFMDPRTLGNHLMNIILIITMISVLKVFLCFFNTEDTIDVHIGSQEVAWR